MKSQQFFVLGFSLLVLIVLFQATPAPGQVACGWYNGHPTVDYLGCATDGNGIPVGRNFRIQIPLKAFDPNNRFHTDSKYLHIIATNTTRGGSPTSVWCSECDYFPPGGISGIVTNIFTLYDADFRPRDRVRIDYYWDPLGKCQLGGLCEAGVYETNYPAAIPPQIVQQPQSSALCQGSTAIFFVVAAEGEMI